MLSASPPSRMNTRVIRTVYFPVGAFIIRVFMTSIGIVSKVATPPWNSIRYIDETHQNGMIIIHMLTFLPRQMCDLWTWSERGHVRGSNKEWREEEKS